jgi:hypothetical protein
MNLPKIETFILEIPLYEKFEYYLLKTIYPSHNETSKRIIFISSVLSSLPQGDLREYKKANYNFRRIITLEIRLYNPILRVFQNIIMN